MIEPIGRIAEILEGVVDREHDPLHSDLGHGVEQRGRAEVTRRGEMEIGTEIIRNRTARCVFVGRLHPVVAVVDSPKIVR
jgi:hypothetical protein